MIRTAQPGIRGVYSRAVVNSRKSHPKLGDKEWDVGKKRASAAAVGTRIAAVELLDVELGRRERAALAGLRIFRTKIAFVGGISAPFAKAVPEAAQRGKPAGQAKAGSL